jgi:hypothetical protein
MIRFTLLLIACIISMIISGQNRHLADEPDAMQFKSPSAAYGPYVWWHWLGYNITREGIRKDFEAMKSAGIAGATMFQIASTATNRCAPIKNSYTEGITYFNDQWWDLVKFTAAEAKKNGIELGMHNCAGWSMSGGPWITPEKSMQKVVWSELKLIGPRRFEGFLHQPQSLLNYYEDIAVLLVPDGEPSLKSVIDISKEMNEEGKLIIEVPVGNFTIFRFGHTSTGQTPVPMPEDIKALEADKMSSSAMTIHMQNLLGPLEKNIGEYLGNTFKHILFDSYEAGDQNWTPLMKQEFFKRKGYDIIPWLPVYAGRIIGSRDSTTRFRNDLKGAIAGMFAEYSYGIPRDMINKLGLQILIEPYASSGVGPFNGNDVIPIADVPMTEFWSHQVKIAGANISASAAFWGKDIIGAEAFTGSPEYSRWSESPSFLKYSGDIAFSNGVNRLILHHWVHQPFPDSIRPGMSMGRWGTHFGRNQTWFEPARSWITYLSRCQYMLQKGARVSDFLTIENYIPGGDPVSENTFLNHVRLEDGKFVSPSGRPYALLVVPDKKSISCAVLKKIAEMVFNGAVVYGPKPLISNGLKDHIYTDEKTASLANLLWKGIDSTRVNENMYGKGRVIWGCSLQEALAKVNINPDIIFQEDTESVYWHHRLAGNTDIYYFTNTQAIEKTLDLIFRVKNKIPEIWNPDTGETTSAPLWNPLNEGTFMKLKLKANQSLFVVFQTTAGKESFAKEVRTALPDSTYEIAKNGSGEWMVKSRLPGRFDLVTSKGIKSAVVDAVPPGINITGKWKVSFSPAVGDPFDAIFDELQSWTLSENDAIRYFSGTAVYSNTFKIPDGVTDASVILNLGTVKELASVTINGNFIRVLWHAPFKVDISKYIRKGENSVSIAVTNTWANRMLGDNTYPDDCEWGKELQIDSKNSAGSSLAYFPDWLLKDRDRPSSKRVTFTTWNYFTKEYPLIESGLLSDIKLEFLRNETFK